MVAGRTHLLATLILLLATGCRGGDSGPAAPDGESPIVSIAISPSSSTIVLGQPLQLTATAQGRDGNIRTGVTFTWSSSDTSIAKVSATGAVTSIAEGGVSITASAENRSGTAGVTTLRLRFVELRASQDATNPLMVAPEAFTCGRTTDGALYCWGWSLPNGDGTTNQLTTSFPQGIAGNLRFSSFAVGGGHICGVSASQLYCWGNNSWGQTGTGTISGTVSAPTRVTGAPPLISALSAGSYHTCALDDSGVAYCWGAAVGGQLGIGSGVFSNSPCAPYACRTTPVRIETTPITFSSISAGYDFWA